MRKLLVDTSGIAVSAGIFEGLKKINCLSVEAGREYNRLLIPVVDRLLREAGVKPGAIDIFGAALGPGSFTGIRVGVAAMKGMAQALSRQFAGISTLDIVAASAGSQEKIMALIGAGRNEFYAAGYEGGVLKTPYMLLSREEAEAEAEKGTCFVLLENEPYAGLLPAKSVKYRIKGVSMEVFNEIIEKNGVKGLALDVSPVYVRKSEAEIVLLKKQKGEL